MVSRSPFRFWDWLRTFLSAPIWRPALCRFAVNRGTLNTRERNGFLLVGAEKRVGGRYGDLLIYILQFGNLVPATPGPAVQVSDSSTP